MTDGTATWSTRLIGAGCTVVIVIGAFAISGHDSGGSSKPGGNAITGAPSPGTAGGPSKAPAPKPTASSPGTPSAVPSQASSPVMPASPVPSQGEVATSPRASAVPSTAPRTTASPASTPKATPIPAGVLGSFRYATTGSEETSIPGTKRTFPATTTITNKAAGCGVESTWAPIPQHVQSQELCPTGKSIYMADYKTTLSFYGISSGEDFKCGTDALIYQPGAKVGQVWNYRCKSSDATATEAGRVLGYSTMTVGGTSVRVLHVKVDVAVSGAESGSSTQEYWIETTKPVLVKETGSVKATQHNVQYQDSYSLTLDSLTPKSKS